MEQKLLQIIALFALLVLTACANSAVKGPAATAPSGAKGVSDVSGERATTAARSDAETQVAAARVVVSLGRVKGQIFSYPNRHAADFFINGTKVGTVGQGDCLIVDLEPGVYNFYWSVPDSEWSSVHSGHVADMLQPGQQASLKLDIERNAGSFLGPIGWWADPDRGHIVGAAARSGSSDEACASTLRSSVAVRPIAGPTTDLPPSW